MTGHDLRAAYIAAGIPAAWTNVYQYRRDAGVRDLEASGFGRRDVLVGISASGRTPYVLGAVGKAREINAVTCGISCVRDSDLSRVVQYPIEPVPGPEILTGSTRLRAG